MDSAEHLQWHPDETFRVVEIDQGVQGFVRVKYIFPDGSSQYVVFRDWAYSPANRDATGRKLAEDPGLRMMR